MIAPQPRPPAPGLDFDVVTTRPRRRGRRRLLSYETTGLSPWRLFLDDRRAIHFKWGLLALFLLVAALIDLPL